MENFDSITRLMLFLITIFSLFGTALAGPPGLYLCKPPGFAATKGNGCEYIPNTKKNKCVDFTGNITSWDYIGSIGPDQGQTCYIYQEAGCTGLSVKNSGIVWPGNWNVKTQGLTKDSGAWKPKSFFCQ